MNLKQFKLTNNDEIICEVVDHKDSESDSSIIIRKALKIIVSEDFSAAVRYYSFKPLLSFQDKIDELVVMNVGHIICESLPSHTLVVHYAKAIKEVEKSEMGKADLNLDDWLHEIEDLDEEELSIWVQDKLRELDTINKESTDFSEDSDNPNNVITFKPKGGTYH